MIWNLLHWFGRRQRRREVLTAWRKTASTGDSCYYIGAAGQRNDCIIVSRLGDFVFLRSAVKEAGPSVYVDIKGVFCD